MSEPVSIDEWQARRNPYAEAGERLPEPERAAQGESDTPASPRVTDSAFRQYEGTDPNWDGIEP